MEGVVTYIHQLSNQGQLSELHEQLRRDHGILCTHAAGGGLLRVVAAALDERQHSLGILHLLAAQSQGLGEGDVQPYFNQVKSFLAQCDMTQVQAAPKLYVTVCHAFVETATRLSCAIQAILPLQEAIRNFTAGLKTEHALTPMHADLLQLALLSGCYHVGLATLDGMDVFGVDPTNTLLTDVDFLRYWFYGGLVCIGLKKFRKAMDCFRVAIATPAIALSAVVVESYKKFVLVSLLETGELPAIPPYASNVVTRSLKPLCKPYHNLGQRFVDDDRAGLEREFATHLELLEADNNVGLAKQVLAAFTERRIKRLTNTYLTLSLDAIARNVEMDSAAEVEKALLSMIEKGAIHAQIEQSSSMVRFLDSDEDCGSAQMTVRLEHEMQQIVQLSDRVQHLDAIIAKSPVYLSKVSSERAGGVSSGAGLADDAALAESLSPEDFGGGGFMSEDA